MQAAATSSVNLELISAINTSNLLSTTARVVGVDLCIDGSATGNFLVHKKNLAKKLGISLGSVTKAFRELIQAGFCVAQEVHFTGRMTMGTQNITEPEPEAPAPGVVKKASHEPEQLDIEDAIARKVEAASSAALPAQAQVPKETPASPRLPVHLCGGKYTLLGPETQLNAESRAILEEGLKSDEVLTVGSIESLPLCIRKYHGYLMQFGNYDDKIVQGNQIRLAFWRLKEMAFPSHLKKIEQEHMAAVETALKALN